MQDKINKYTAVILCDDRVMIQHLTATDRDAADRAIDLAEEHAESDMFWSIIPGHVQAQKLMPMCIGLNQ